MNTHVSPGRGKQLLRADRAYRAGGVLARLMALAPAALFHRLLDRIDTGLLSGTIEGHLPDGSVRLLGGRGEGPTAIVHLHSWAALARLALSGSIGWYRAWEKGEWTSPDPVPLFDLFVRNRATLGDAGRASGATRLAKRAWHWLRRNHRDGARRNIAYHYDLGNDFYEPWLDRSMTYSSALFERRDMTLEQAQQAKLDAILARTGTAVGEAILEIGCGWGSFAETAARAGCWRD